MLLLKAIKEQLDRVKKANKPSVSLKGQGFSVEEIEEVILLLNQYPTITEVNLSRNSLVGCCIEKLLQLTHIKKLTLISCNVNHKDALVLCHNENLSQLVLSRPEFNELLFDNNKASNRANSLVITITDDIDNHRDTVIQLGQQEEVTATPHIEVAGNDTVVATKPSRGENHSSDTARSSECGFFERNKDRGTQKPGSCCQLV